MKKYTANYSYSNHNFVIQNLTGAPINNKYLPAICILQNILQRGKPTLLSKFLQKHLGSIHKLCSFKKPYPLIDPVPPKWARIIRGDVKGNYFPAKKFFEELIPAHLPNYKFIQQLIIPEIPINEITQVEVDEFAQQQVDFYLPQAYLIIEIDGSPHKRNIHQDQNRDEHTAKYGIKTIRIKTSDLEAENDVFHAKVNEIKERIEEAILSQKVRRKSNPTFISIEDYKTAFEKGINLSNPNYLATAIIRFQLLVLELLARGILDFSEKWKFEILERDISDFAELAIKDLTIWFEHLFRLHKIEYQQPNYSITKIDTIEGFTNSTDSIKVDFSLLKRYTDECQTNENIIFVRTDYLDEYRYFKNGDALEPKFSSIEPHDYFQVSTTDLIEYELNFGDEDSDEEPLRFLLENIFLQDIPNPTFNPGQLPIIKNALARNDTIGLLPTAGGKSVCYQLAAILQPAISFVVCPIKSLMYDQEADLDSVYFTRVNHVTSDDDAEDKEKIQQEFSKGKYFFIFISPERFQIKKFREYFKLVNKDFKIAYAVIDEVHCLSEWGHDFRTSYLNLSNTIQKLCNNFNFIGLTATASLNVLKDIQIEFGITQENVFTLVDYTREELEFEVIDDRDNKFSQIKDRLRNLDEEMNILQPNGSDSKCGIIFTPTVNGWKGCYQLSLELSKHFHKDIKYYSGAVPEIGKKPKKPIMTDKEFGEYKKRVQDEFKENKLTLLTATKAFGMGINKPNIHFTVHYGIPGSMESLYQEGGRAGRDKEKFAEEKAKCFVLLSKSKKPKDFVDKIWEIETPLSELKKLQKAVDGDLDTNLWLFVKDLDIIPKEVENIKKLHERYSSPSKKPVCVEGEQIGVNKAKTEKAIYRLSQLGIIQDWTITNFFRDGVFEVDYADYSPESIKESLLKTINKYDPNFSFERVNEDDKYKMYRIMLNDEGISDFEKYVGILLLWSYNNFAYHRRQSLKTIYEKCCDVSDGKITKEEFKNSLEDYFKFKELGFVLQHIAEKPRDYEKWFEVFYQVVDNTVTDNFLTRRQQQGLRDSLSRFLESYRYNPGLDLISGLVRLLLDDYENVDGHQRLESSLNQIQDYESNKIENISNHILKIGKELSDENKNFLAESLHQSFTDNSFLHRIQEELRDSYSMITIIENANERLREINRRIYEQLTTAGEHN